MTKLEQITALLKNPLAEKGYEILQLRYIKMGRPTLQFLLERLDEAPVTIEDCTRASRLISVALDVEDPIPEAYTLEVSSPGVDRPLIRLRDYERFQGLRVKLELKEPYEEKRRFKGVIASVSEGKITFDLESETDSPQRLTLALAEIYHCKLSPLL